MQNATGRHDLFGEISLPFAAILAVLLAVMCINPPPIPLQRPAVIHHPELRTVLFGGGARLGYHLGMGLSGFGLFFGTGLRFALGSIVLHWAPLRKSASGKLRSMCSTFRPTPLCKHQSSVGRSAVCPAEKERLSVQPPWRSEPCFGTCGCPFQALLFQVCLCLLFWQCSHQHAGELVAHLQRNALEDNCSGPQG